MPMKVILSYLYHDKIYSIYNNQSFQFGIFSDLFQRGVSSTFGQIKIHENNVLTIHCSQKIQVMLNRKIGS